MTAFRKTGERGRRYDFRAPDCIGKHCWAPGEFYHRGATSGGSRATGSSSLCCLSRAYRGCPTDACLPELVARRKAEGWRVA